MAWRRRVHPADSWLIALYSAAVVVAVLLAARGLQRAADRRRQLADSAAAARHSDRVAQLIGALAAARTPVAAAEAAVLEPVQALDARAGLIVLVGRDGQLGEVAHAVGYGDDEARVRASLTPPRRSAATDAVARGA